jgi:Mrp family chromosome partitioning ATPase
MLETWKEQYEYIIIDLPPVTEVADALIVSRLTDGIIVVVRQDYTDQRLLADIIQQLRHSESNIIGFVMTCAPNETKYCKYKYRKYHARKYGYGCYSAYEQAAQEGEKQDNVSV